MAAVPYACPRCGVHSVGEAPVKCPHCEGGRVACTISFHTEADLRRFISAEKSARLLSQVALEAIRLIHGQQLGDHYSHEACDRCGLGGHGDLRDALTKALGPLYMELVWGLDMNCDSDRWDAALRKAAEVNSNA